MKRQHLIILLAFVCCLLGWKNEAMADSYTKTFTSNVTVTFTISSGNKFKVAYSDATTPADYPADGTVYDDIGNINLNTKNLEVTFKFKSGTFLMSSRMYVQRGHLIIQPNGNNSATLKRKSGNDQRLFYVNNTTTTAIANAHLTIKGTSASYRMIIDGGATWDLTGSNANGWTATKTGGVTAHAAMFIFRAGQGTFNYVTFQNAWNDCPVITGTPPNATAGDGCQGGVFRVYTVSSGTPSASRNGVTLTDCIIQKCYCKGQGAAMQVGGPLITTNSYVNLVRTTVQNCYTAAAYTDVNGNDSGGGVFRTGGSGTCNLSFTDCTLKNNVSNQSGTITWNAGIAALTLSGCTLQDNYSGTHGGALSLWSVAKITNCTFQRNYAVSNGGAIAYYTYVNNDSSLPNLQVENGTLTMDATTKITNNTAGNYGGGLYINLRPMNCLNGSTHYTVFKNVDGDQYEVHFNINGATISNNTAGNNGGGVYLRRGTDIYKTDLNFSYGTIENNTSSVNGGGFYVTSGVGDTFYGSLPSGCTRTNLNVNVGKSETTTKANMWANKGNNGGGIYATGTKLVFNVYPNAVIGKSGSPNQAVAASTGAGGGVFFNGTENNGTYGSFTMNGGIIDYNTSVANGAGIYIGNGTCTIKGGSITNNQSTSGSGGGIFVNPAGSGAVTTLNSSSAALSVSSNKSVHGAGIFVNQGSLTITKSTNNLNINSNVASGSGGGIFAKGAVSISGATISSNTATSGKGGGIYAEAGTNTIEVKSSTTIQSNKSKYGGGLFAESGNITLTTSTISSNEASNTDDAGGGIYGNGGNITVSGGSIASNKATGTGGKGGGIYTASGTITVQLSGSTVPAINGNQAGYGGALFMNGGTCSLTACNIGTTTANTASVDGGGIYANGTVNFSNGNIQNNTATSNGGGVYISNNGTLNISGTANITGNKVTSGTGKGGGVYQGGVMFADGSAFTVISNTKDTGAKESTKNNVYLPQTKTVKVGPNISTSVNLGIFTEKTVDENGGNLIPVLTCDAANIAKLSAIYNAMLTGTSNIHDDRSQHYPVYEGDDPTGKTLYFGKIDFDYGPWDEAYEGPITDIETLYQYMCWVNGVNGYGTPHPTAMGEMAADVNADGLTLWIPIGEQNVIGETEPFKGTFNGNGHRIDGLDIDNLLYSNYGLFGTTQGATIDNVFVTGCNFAKNTTGTMGTVVGHMQGGTLSNCTGSGSLTTTASDCIVGGLVGKVEMDGSTAATIHSSYAGATLEGYQMGGLIGDLASGCSLYNSFANPQFDYSGPSGSSANFVGGLVAVNSGTVQNCYVRFSRTNSGLANARFGQLAGSAGSNLVSLCYTPETFTTVPAAIMNTGTLTYDTYGTVVAPYLYNTDGDNLVTGTSSKLVNTLNTWVNSHSGYTPWRRTMAGGTAYTPTAGDINGDYPVHQYSGTKCVGSPDGIQLDYASSLDAMLLRYPTAGTINLYEDDEAEGSTGANVVVYIDEGVCLLQGDDSEIEAYTCQTLPGDPRGWHFLSSSLEGSHIGFNYGIGSQVPFNWDPNPCHVTIDGNDDYSLFPSDLPLAGGYADMTRLDLFTFYEPEYHWVNLKRNSNSHWHMDATTAPINYSNETDLEPGRGYLVTFDKDQLLQNRGTLNNGEVTVGVTRTMAAAWAGFLGCNLIGNPYQSYLDFDRFATVNSGLWTGKSSAERTYAVYDPQEQAYVQYKEGTSRGAKAATGTLNMHQGFFVKVTSDATTQAVFNNTMRTDTPAAGTHFRGPQHAYPLVNLTVRDDEGHGDVVVLELGRDSDEGANKIEVSDTKGRLALRHGGQDYGILFRSEIEDYQPLGFEAREAGTFTLSWETANAQFESLTLVDNITGATIDMLARDSYSFEATPDQYASRFKIVVGEYKGIEEEDGSSTGPVTFAYQTGDQLVVEGEGLLQVVDMLGHVVRTEQLTDVRSTVALPATAGVYVLRLVGSNGTRTQKMVIR